MIDYRNNNRTERIPTIEDTKESVNQHKKSIVYQRQVGTGALSHYGSLKNAVREAPEAIQVGEIRDRETMQHAIACAEAGHLRLSILRAENANEAIDRIVNFLPESAYCQRYLDLSINPRAVVSQRLVFGIGGKPLCPPLVPENPTPLHPARARSPCGCTQWQCR